jgi:alpha-tubulin suppressor-like RCC1 family protein
MDGSLWVLDPLPRRLGSDKDWINITVGGSHFVAVKRDRSLWAWGENTFGQLGDGTTDFRAEPVRIGTNTGWVGIVAGGDIDPIGFAHTVALHQDGTIWAWGANAYGQVGDGSLFARLEPVRVGSDTNWNLIAAGCQFTLALKTDGTLWSWGLNDNGQLGDGTTQTRTVPVQTGTDRDWAAIAAGGTSASSFTVALKTDGSLWAWGANGRGQLGDGTTTRRLTPTRIGTDTDWGLPR